MSKPAKYLEIEDVEILEVLNSPIRLRILRRLMEPMTVKALAKSMDVPVTRLYFHINLLAEAGVIRVVEMQKVGAIPQRTYQATALRFVPGKKLMEDRSDPQKLSEVIAAAVLDGARLDAEAGLLAHFEALGRGEEGDHDTPGAIGRALAFMTPKTALKFAARVERLATQMGNVEDVEDGVEYAFSFVVFPMTGPFGTDSE